MYSRYSDDLEFFPITYLMSKSEIPRAGRSHGTTVLLLSLVVIAFVALWTHFPVFTDAVRELGSEDVVRSALRGAGDFDVCPQQPPFNPTAALRGTKIVLPSLRQTVERISHTVRIDTSVDDDAPTPEENPSWWSRVFSPYHKWLNHAFPHLHTHLSREIIHNSGLLFTWHGSDLSLKPLLLTAHQDVVPVNKETATKWRFSPFSGYIDLDTQTIWGRGSFDCKAHMIGVMSAIDSLAAAGWRPRRTIVLSFGYDEESGGQQGAKALGKTLLERYGKDSFAMLVDEGLPLMPMEGPGSIGRAVASPAVQEKGTVSVVMSISMPGGHSSMPPPHTSIGIMSEIINVLEENPFVPKITGGYNPALQRLQCIRDAPAIDPALRDALYELSGAEKMLANAGVVDGLRITTSELRNRIEDIRARILSLLPPSELNMFVTSQAVDVVKGGVKINALPESVTAGVNHRIAPHETVDFVLERFRAIVVPIAKKYNLEIDFFGTPMRAKGTPTGKITFNTTTWTLDSPTGSPYDAPAWHVFSGVVRETWDESDPRRSLSSDVENSDERSRPVLVAPALLMANTDTHWYSELTRNVYRFGPSSIHEDLTGLGHGVGMRAYLLTDTIDEHMSIDGMAQSVRFYTNLILAVDYENL